ncbi:NAD(P)H-dependent oxidoreductase [Streptomyces laurentii]
MPSVAGVTENSLPDRLADADGFVLLTPEYNHSYPAALKNAIDWHLTEWAYKPVAFVGYGGSGGIRAVAPLRTVFPLWATAGEELVRIGRAHIGELQATVNELATFGFLQTDVVPDRRRTGPAPALTGPARPRVLVTPPSPSWRTCPRTPGPTAA